MGAGRRRRSRFLCFGGAADAVADEDQLQTKAAGIEGFSPETRRKGRRRLIRRILAGIFRSSSFQDCSGKSRENSRKPGPELRRNPTGGGDRRTEAALSSSLSSSFSSAAPSSSSLSASSSSSRSLPPLEPKIWREKLPESTRRIRDPAAGMCLLAASLFVMVFCGRLCSILLTTASFCLVFRRSPYAGDPPESAAVSPELRRKGTDEYEKKRVVLEGLLERNRRRV